jgi:hypothetical protein
MNELHALLLNAFATAVGEEYPELTTSITNDTNIYEIVDSFAIVSMLLESEAAIEVKYGRYIPLADETIFDASKSPFVRWEGWVEYVQGKINAK